MSEAVPCLDLRPDHWAIVRDILSRQIPDRKVLAFGSRATWTAKEHSDLDLAILGDAPLSLEETSALAESFTESDLPFKVDLVDWTKIDETFRSIIRRDGLPVQVPLKHSEAVDRARRPAGGEWRHMCGTARPGWPMVAIQDIAEKVAMGPFGSSIKVETFVPDGVPIISGQHLHGSRVDDSPGHNFISPEHAKRLANANVQRGDIVFTHSGNIGQVAYVPANSGFDRYIVSQRQFYLRCDRSKAIPEFVAAYFGSPEGQHKLLANSSQVGVPSIAQPVTYLRTVGIPLPPLAEQRAIAHILGTLDDKIELNRRMNATLEAMVRALFNSWFVDFDPVRAKIAGRDTGLPRHIADIFPDSIDEEGKPEGWRVGTLADAASCPRRVISPTDVADATPYIGLEHMPRRSISLIKWENASKVTSNKSAFKAGEFLFGKLRPYFHKVGLAPIDGICSTDIVVVVPRGSQWSVFTLACLCSDEFVRYTDQTSTGTKMPRTSWKTMQRYKIPVPPKVVARAFQSLAQPLIDRLTENVHESRNLSQARDVLLPKLVSGETRFRDPKWLMGEVA